MKNPLIVFISYTIIKFILYLDLQIRPFPELVFLDVGQGDAILITTQDKRKVLIDGGAGFTVSQRLNSYFPLNNCALDAVFLTHPHADHLEGLNRLLQNCRVDKVFYTPVLYASTLFETWKALVTAKKDTIDSSIWAGKTEFEPFLAGDIYYIDVAGKVKLYGIWPPPDYVGKNISNINNVSTVMFLDAGNFEALLTGDAEVAVLQELEKPDFQFLQGPLEVYKLSHHGSVNGFKPSFWRQLNPLLTVISVGEENKFGHPHPEVISWLEKARALYKRTDMEGTIKIRYNSL